MDAVCDQIWEGCFCCLGRLFGKVVSEYSELLSKASFEKYRPSVKKYSKNDANFFAAFTPATGSLGCEGRLGGGPCPRQVQVDLRSSASACGAGLQGLHLDHTHTMWPVPPPTVVKKTPNLAMARRL